ncbi:MAG: hypothetical protein AAB368_13310, partial [bacterium]
MHWPLTVSDQDSERSYTISAIPALPEEAGAIRERSPLLLAGEGTAHVAHDLVATLLARGQRVVAADGANRFDSYHLARAARRLGKPAAEMLAAVRVSRAFTWQQYVALLERDIAAEAARVGAAWVLALGPLDLLADEEVKPWQAAAGAKRVADALAALARAGLGILVAQDERPLKTSGREDLMRLLERACRNHVTVSRRGLFSGAGRTSPDGVLDPRRAPETARSDGDASCAPQPSLRSLTVSAGGRTPGSR